MSTEKERERERERESEHEYVYTYKREIRERERERERASITIAGGGRLPGHIMLRTFLQFGVHAYVESPYVDADSAPRVPKHLLDSPPGPEALTELAAVSPSTWANWAPWPIIMCESFLRVLWSLVHA